MTDHATAVARHTARPRRLGAGTGGTERARAGKGIVARSTQPSAVRVWVGPEGAELRRRLRNVVALAAITYAIAVSEPGVGLSGSGLAVTLLLIAANLGWLCLIFMPFGRRMSLPLGLLVTGVAGTILTFVSPHSAAVAYVGIAVVRAAWWWPPSWSIEFGTVLGIAYLIGHLGVDDSAAWLLAGPAVIVLGLLVGFVRRQNDLLAAEVRIARDEQARSAALDERARIAREIHDVLAHSLGALSVQLETADALIEGGRTEQAHASVRRAGQLAKEGLT